MRKLKIFVGFVCRPKSATMSNAYKKTLKLKSNIKFQVFLMDLKGLKKAGH